jgi:phytoene dehydrogenase-like protein
VTVLIDQHAPGFAKTIVGRSVQSPATLETQNPAQVGGAINGGTAQLHQQLIFRPVVGLGGADTPIHNLYLAGSSAHPGGGVHGGPGSNAALAALHNEGARGTVRRRTVRAAMRRIYR